MIKDTSTKKNRFLDNITLTENLLDRAFSIRLWTHRKNLSPLLRWKSFLITFWSRWSEERLLDSTMGKIIIFSNIFTVTKKKSTEGQPKLHDGTKETVVSLLNMNTYFLKILHSNPHLFFHIHSPYSTFLSSCRMIENRFRFIDNEK